MSHGSLVQSVFFLTPPPSLCPLCCFYFESVTFICVGMHVQLNPHVRHVSSCNKKEINTNCCVSNKVWTVKCLFTEVKEKAVSLFCSSQVAVFKDYKLNHSVTKHAEKYKNSSEGSKSRCFVSYKTTHPGMQWCHIPQNHSKMQQAAFWWWTLQGCVHINQCTCRSPKQTFQFNYLFLTRQDKKIPNKAKKNKSRSACLSCRKHSVHRTTSLSEWASNNKTKLQGEVKWDPIPP